ncbi:MAG: TldD/PmbA family protein [Bacteroidales bacterium]|nr:TldD/PmbA family protein [Bacteroidales bacterium]
MEGLISEQEERLAQRCLEHALSAGAGKARVVLSKNLTELYGTLNGSLDKVSRSMDRALMFNVFANGRFGSFSANRLEEKELFPFIEKAVRTVEMLAEDPCRDLPNPSRTEKGAVTGTELGLLDTVSLTPDDRLGLALDAAAFGKIEDARFKVISEEGEYSDTVGDTLLLDSNGLRCRHSETSFDYAVETTIEDVRGNRIAGYWWDSAPRLENLDIKSCGFKAAERAASLIGPSKTRSGPATVVIDNTCGSTLLNPILTALNGYSLQQKNSFLDGTLGKSIFSGNLTVSDRGREPGRPGSRLFDSEGVAVREGPIIDRGKVSKYFINTYISNKMGIPPTVDDATRPVILPAGAPDDGPFDLDRIMSLCGDGILVTGFNGGNSNPTTGDFSFGIEGILFRDGKPVHPVREMLMTGNFITLWNNLLYAGNDPRPCMSKLIPTLAFGNVTLSA